MAELFDKVRLKSGQLADIVEVYEKGVAYEADIELGDNEYDTDTIFEEDIVEIVRPYASLNIKD